MKNKMTNASTQCGPECECFRVPSEQLARMSKGKGLGPVYLDHAATTPVRPEVVEAMLPYLSQTFGNASSIHRFGQEARRALDDARETVATCIGAESDEICFTSGGTESDNLAILGVIHASGAVKGHPITSRVEHPAVLNCFRHLEQDGYGVTYLPVDRFGIVDIRDIKVGVQSETNIISVMLANNETGTLQPVKEIAEVAHRRGVPVHTDAVQAIGKIPVNVNDLEVDLLSISAHKIYGPKGVGALYIRKGTRIDPLLHGGHHEHGRRPGTENVAGIVGFAKAIALATEDISCASEHLAALRDRLEHRVAQSIANVHLNGHPRRRLPNILNLSIEGVEGESLLLALDLCGIAVSTGSACTSGSLGPSHVLSAMRVAPELARGSLRFSLGRDNTEEQMDFVAERLAEAVERLRGMSPLDVRAV